MGQILHGSARTTEAVRRAIQHSQESIRALAGRYGINPKTVAKWKRRTTTVAKALHAVASFLRDFTKNAEQLTTLQRWRAILSKAFKVFLNECPLRLPPRLAPS
jgi:transposase-like protein